MISGIVGFFKFYLLRILRAQPIGAGLALVAVLFLMVSMVAWLEASRQLESSSAQLTQVREQASRRISISRTPVVAASGNSVLPWFQCAQLSDQLRRVADDAGVPYDEVTYTLEEGTQQPFLRYRISMTVAASYPAVRRFIDGLRGVMAHIELDAITCKRADISAVPVTCELAFSAFFRKDPRG